MFVNVNVCKCRCLQVHRNQPGRWRAGCRTRRELQLVQLPENGNPIQDHIGTQDGDKKDEDQHNVYIYIKYDVYFR